MLALTVNNRSEVTVLQEYMALKRYHSEQQLPARFQGAGERPPPPPPRPGPATSYQELGRFPPSRHTAAATYHGLDTRFTAKIARHGMYRNHSVNL